MRRLLALAFATAVVGICALTATSQPPDGKDGPPRGRGPGGKGKGGPPPKKDDGEQARAGGIQWFATWEAGKAEAERTGRPILFLSAAPHCAGVSGIW